MSEKRVKTVKTWPTKHYVYSMIFYKWRTGMVLVCSGSTAQDSSRFIKIHQDSILSEGTTFLGRFLCTIPWGGFALSPTHILHISAPQNASNAVAKLSKDYSDRSHAVCSKLCNVWQLLEEPPVITTTANLEKLKLRSKARMAACFSIFAVWTIPKILQVLVFLGS